MHGLAYAVVSKHQSKSESSDVCAPRWTETEQEYSMAKHDSNGEREQGRLSSKPIDPRSNFSRNEVPALHRRTTATVYLVAIAVLRDASPRACLRVIEPRVLSSLVCSLSFHSSDLDHSSLS